MNRTTFLYLEAAKALKLPARYREEFNGFSILLSNKIYNFRHGYTPFNTSSNDNIALNKYSVNYILHNAGLPVPKATAISTNNHVNGNWSLPNLNYPIVGNLQPVLVWEWMFFAI